MDASSATLERRRAGINFLSCITGFSDGLATHLRDAPPPVKLALESDIALDSAHPADLHEEVAPPCPPRSLGFAKTEPFLALKASPSGARPKPACGVMN